MIFVVVAQVGWNQKARQDQIQSTVESGRQGKTQWTTGWNDTGRMVGAPFGNYIRVEFNADTDADQVWNQIKNFMATNTPVPGSRWRRLDCNFDAVDPSQQVCTIVEVQHVDTDGTIVNG